MLHLGDQDFICRHETTAIALRHEVDPVGGTAGENHLAWESGIQEPAGLLPYRVIRLRRRLAQVMDAAVNVGIVQTVVAAHGIDDRLRLLRRGGVVEIHQRLAMHLTLKDGEVLSDPLELTRMGIPRQALKGNGGRPGAGAHVDSTPSRCRTRFSSSSLTGSTTTSSMTSAAKAYVRSRWASAAGTPRLLV